MTPPLGRAIVFATGFAQKNDPADYQKDFARHFKVTTDDLKRVAAQYLKPEKVVLWTTPLSKGESKTPEIPAGPTTTEPKTEFALREPANGPDWSRMPGPGKVAPFQAPKFSRKTLSNGLDVWVASWKTLPRVSVRLAIPAGTADDSREKSGLATLTATLLDKGTKTLTATELTEKLQDLGVTLGAGASSDVTSMGFSVIKRHLEPALVLLSEVLTSPRFDSKDFERERDLQLSALKQGPDSVGWIARRAFPPLLYGADHPYGNPGDGFIETVKKLTLDDVKSFHANHLGANGAMLIIVGDVDPEPLMASLETTFGKWAPQKLEPAKRPATTAKAEPGSIYFVDKPGAVQSVLSIGRRWVDRSDSSYFATMIGNRIFGGDFLSRINNNLREVHGFTYGAGSSFTFRRSGSVWSVGTQVRTDATAEALRETLKELDGLAGSKPFTAEEVSTALNAELKSYPETFESPSSIAGILEEMARFHLPPDYLDTYLSLLQATAPEAIAKVMARIVEPEERVILIVGDRKAVEPKLNELGLKKIIPVSVDGVPIRK
jgi:predicted Zn-dependent peptidase